MPEEKNPVDFLRDANDIVKLLTGKSIVGLIKRGSELFGKETIKKVLEPSKPEPGSPYAILGVRPDAATIVIKAKYRSLIKDKSFIECEELREAYLQILSERGEG